MRRCPGVRRTLRNEATCGCGLVDPANGFQPEGLTESSRWSERSADHRKVTVVRKHPEGGARVSETLSGSGIDSLLSGGLRCAPTTGYYLSALQADAGRYVLG